MAIEAEVFGTHQGQRVMRYTLRAGGLELRAIDYGAIVTALRVPDARGQLADIVTGYDDLPSYVGDRFFFGATVGRVANRIGGARCEIDGRTLALEANDPPHHLHGGSGGFHTRVLSGRVLTDTTELAALRFDYVSQAGEAGYPGELHVSVTYTLAAHTFGVEMVANTTATTAVNLAHHSYFNLAGHDAGSVLDHELMLFADAYTPGAPVVPDGRVTDVSGTPFDFRSAKPIGRDIAQLQGDPGGYDHNFVVRGAADQLREVARLVEPRSGRVMELSANQPGVQFYSGNFLDGTARGKHASYPKRSALCLETQAFPNAVNVPEWRPSVLLEPGATYRHVMQHRFSVV